MSKVSNIHLNASIIPPAVKLGLFLLHNFYVVADLYAYRADYFSKN